MKALAIGLVLLTACATPPALPFVSPAPDTSAIPLIPQAFPTELGPVPVIWVDSIPDDRAGYTTFGRFNPLRREIWMWKGITSRAEAWRVALHEYCHVLHWDRGIRFQDETTERMCDVFAYALAPLALRR